MAGYYSPRNNKKTGNITMKNNNVREQLLNKMRLSYLFAPAMGMCFVLPLLAVAAMTMQMYWLAMAGWVAAIVVGMVVAFYLVGVIAFFLAYRAKNAFLSALSFYCISPWCWMELWDEMVSLVASEGITEDEKRYIEMHPVKVLEDMFEKMAFGEKK